MDNLDLEGLMAQESQLQGEQDEQGSGLDLGMSQSVGGSAAKKSQLNQLKKQYDELGNKLMHAMGNDYAGYKLDTDQKGQMYYGNKSHAALERDKLMHQQLRDRINDLREEIRQEQAAAQTSTKSAAQLARDVFQSKINYVNKNLRGDVRARFQQQVQAVDWGTQQLRNDQAKKGLLVMLFNHARGEAEEARQSALKNKQESGSSEYIDASSDDYDDDGQPAAKKNEYGHEEGSAAFEISERFKSRRNQNRILGQRPGDKE